MREVKEARRVRREGPLLAGEDVVESRPRFIAENPNSAGENVRRAGWMNGATAPVKTYPITALEPMKRVRLRNEAFLERRKRVD